MMGYGDDSGSGWMSWFGVVMMLVVLVVIGLGIWAIVTVTNRNHAAASASPVSSDTGGRERIKQALDERYARGEMNTEDYSERLHTLGL